jgi:hypothetical protein
MLRNKKIPFQARATTFFLLPCQASLLPRYLVTKADPSLTSSEKAVVGLFEEGETLVKIVPTTFRYSPTPKTVHCFIKHPWTDHLRQLSDFSYRPHIRKNEEEMNKVTYRHNTLEASAQTFIYFHYNHLTDKIEVVDSRKPQKQENYTHTQATSTTLVSTHLHTPLITCFEEDGVPMGLAYDRRLCKVEAMFSDMDMAYTYDNRWVSSDLSSVESYRQYIAPYLFRDISEFRKEIAKHRPHVVNEVLSQLCPEAIRCVVVYANRVNDGNSDFAAQKARERCADVKKECGHAVPIVYYDSDRKEISFYTRDEQDLHKLRKILHDKLYLGRSSSSPKLFTCNDLTYSFEVKGFIKGKMTRETAFDTIKLIDSYESQGCSASEVKKMIKSKGGSLTRQFPSIVI